VGTLFALNIAPRIDLSGEGLGPGPDGFGFHIIWYSNQVVCVEASTEATFSVRQPLTTITLGAGPTHFLDQGYTDFPQRFYRLRAE
jgi:hypothetical protein